MGFVENINILANELTPETISSIKSLVGNTNIVEGSFSQKVYLTDGLPTSGSIGDLTVNVIDGGIYEYNGTTWILIAQAVGSTTSTGTSSLGVDIVTGLPTSATNGAVVFNNADGYFYGYINGVWTQMVSSPTASDVIGIEVVPSNPTTGNFEGRTVFNTSTNMLMKYSAGVWIQVVEPTTAAATVAAGSLTTAAFAATIKAVEVFDVLPTTDNSVGRLVFLTTDSQIYRYTATGFTISVPTSALTGTITSTQIGANQITTGALAVGAVTADTIAANAITSDKITANSITTGMIQAGAIGATQIATNAITADKVNAGAITATKIAALSIDATKIIAGSISGDKITANSITSGLIAAGAISASHIAAKTITANQIATGTISANELAAYSITADKIQAGAITADKISSGTISLVGNTKGTISMGSDNTALMKLIKSNLNTTGASLYIDDNSSGFYALGVTHRPISECALFEGLGKGSDVVRITTNANSEGLGINGGAYCLLRVTGSSYSPALTVFQRYMGNIDAHAARMKHLGSGASGIVGLASGKAFYAESGTYGPFTGAHDAVIHKNINIDIGDIVEDYMLVRRATINDTIYDVKPTSTAMSKTVIGVVSTIHELSSQSIPASFQDSNFMDTIKHKGHSIEEEAFARSPLLKEYDITHNILAVNAIGEGQLNVCGINGSIDAGDYICSSILKGKGMKQDSDVLHNYTVAKSRESVTFDYPEQIKMIACTYHCG